MKKLIYILTFLISGFIQAQIATDSIAKFISIGGQIYKVTGNSDTQYFTVAQWNALSQAQQDAVQDAVIVTDYGSALGLFNVTDLGAADKTLTQSDFNAFGYTDNTVTFTVDDTPVSSSRLILKNTDIDSVISVVPAAGVSFIGTGTGVISNAFKIDSLNAATITKLYANTYSVDGYVKPFIPVDPGIYDALNALEDFNGNETNAITGVTENNGSGTLASVATTSPAVGSTNMIQYTVTANSQNTIYIAAPSTLQSGVSYTLEMNVSCNCPGGAIANFRVDTSDGYGVLDVDTNTLSDGTWEVLTISGTWGGTNSGLVRIYLGGTPTIGDVISFDGLRWVEN